MSKKIYIDVLIALVFLGLLGLYVNNHYISPSKKKSPATLKLVKANDILRRKTTIPEKFLNTTATSSACTLFLKNSAELSMNDFANEFIDHHIDEIVKTCAGAFPTPLQLSIDKALLDCKSSTRDHITKECYAALIETKTRSVAAIIKPDARISDLDISILLHLIADRFSSGDFMESPERSLEILDAIIEKEPNYLGSYKLKLMLLAMSSLNTRAHYKDVFEDTLIDATALSPDDPEIKEIVLAKKGIEFKQAGDNKSFIEYLDQESAKYPQDWVYDYYKALTLFEEGKGDSQAAIGLVEKALGKAPNESRLHDTLMNFKSDDYEKRKHPFIISVGFTLNDL